MPVAAIYLNNTKSNKAYKQHFHPATTSTELARQLNGLAVFPTTPAFVNLGPIARGLSGKALFPAALLKHTVFNSNTQSPIAFVPKQNSGFVYIIEHGNWSSPGCVRVLTEYVERVNHALAPSKVGAAASQAAETALKANSSLGGARSSSAVDEEACAIARFIYDQAKQTYGFSFADFKKDTPASSEKRRHNKTFVGFVCALAGYHTGILTGKFVDSLVGIETEGDVFASGARRTLDEEVDMADHTVNGIGHKMVTLAVKMNVLDSLKNYLDPKTDSGEGTPARTFFLALKTVIGSDKRTTRLIEIAQSRAGSPQSRQELREASGYKRSLADEEMAIFADAFIHQHDVPIVYKELSAKMSEVSGLRRSPQQLKRWKRNYRLFLLVYVLKMDLNPEHFFTIRQIQELGLAKAQQIAALPDEREAGYILHMDTADATEDIDDFAGNVDISDGSDGEEADEQADEEGAEETTEETAEEGGEEDASTRKHDKQVVLPKIDSRKYDITIPSSDDDGASSGSLLKKKKPITETASPSLDLPLSHASNSMAMPDPTNETEARKAKTSKRTAKTSTSKAKRAKKAPKGLEGFLASDGDTSAGASSDEYDDDFAVAASVASVPTNSARPSRSLPQSASTSTNTTVTSKHTSTVSQYDEKAYYATLGLPNDFFPDSDDGGDEGSSDEEESGGQDDD